MQHLWDHARRNAKWAAVDGSPTAAAVDVTADGDDDGDSSDSGDSSGDSSGDCSGSSDDDEESDSDAGGGGDSDCAAAVHTAMRELWLAKCEFSMSDVAFDACRAIIRRLLARRSMRPGAMDGVRGGASVYVPRSLHRRRRCRTLCQQW